MNGQQYESIDFLIFIDYLGSCKTL